MELSFANEIRIPVSVIYKRFDKNELKDSTVY